MKIIISLILLMTILISCGIEQSENSSGKILFIDYDENYYTISIDGYRVGKWWSDYVIFRINPNINEDEPLAHFKYFGSDRSIQTYEIIILEFNNVDEIEKTVKNSNINVQSGRDSIVAYSNSESKSCFINSIIE